MVSYSGGTGSSFEDAIKIVGAESTREGIQAEYGYIVSVLHIAKERWKGKSQKLCQFEENEYDVITVVIDGKKEHVFYFNITDFFGLPPFF